MTLSMVHSGIGIDSSEESSLKIFEWEKFVFAFSNSFILLVVVFVSDEHDERRLRGPFIFGVSLIGLLFSK